MVTKCQIERYYCWSPIWVNRNYSASRMSFLLPLFEGLAKAKSVIMCHLILLLLVLLRSGRELLNHLVNGIDTFMRSPVLVKWLLVTLDWAARALLKCPVSFWNDQNSDRIIGTLRSVKVAQLFSVIASNLRTSQMMRINVTCSERWSHSHCWDVDLEDQLLNTSFHLAACMGFLPKKTHKTKKLGVKRACFTKLIN